MRIAIDDNYCILEDLCYTLAGYAYYVLFNESLIWLYKMFI